MKSIKPTRLTVILSVVLVLVMGGTALVLGAGSRDSTDPDFEAVFTLLRNASSQEEVYRLVGKPQEALDGTDIFIIDGKRIRVSYNEDSMVTRIEYVSEPVANTPDFIGVVLSLDDVRALAAKGKALQHSDLPPLRPSILSSTMGGYNPTFISVEGDYSLLISFNNTMDPESGISSILLRSIWDETSIDIRYRDVDEFIRMNPSHPVGHPVDEE